MRLYSLSEPHSSLIYCLLCDQWAISLMYSGIESSHELHPIVPCYSFSWSMTGVFPPSFVSWLDQLRSIFSVAIAWAKLCRFKDYLFCLIFDHFMLIPIDHCCQSLRSSFAFRWRFDLCPNQSCLTGSDLCLLTVGFDYQWLVWGYRLYLSNVASSCHSWLGLLTLSALSRSHFSFACG